MILPINELLVGEGGPLRVSYLTNSQTFLARLKNGREVMEGTELATHDEWMDKKKYSLRLFDMNLYLEFGRI